MVNLDELHPGLREYVENLKKQLETETDQEKREYFEQQIQAICGEDEEIEEIPEEAEEYVEKLNDIDYKIDEFIDLFLHGEIRDKVEEEKSELLKEEQNREYITTELVLERAMQEIENAIESIKEIYKR